MNGKVKWFDTKKGFGFIVDDEGREHFVHHTGIAGHGHKNLAQGVEGHQLALPTDKGSKAANVRCRPAAIAR